MSDALQRLIAEVEAGTAVNHKRKKGHPKEPFFAAFPPHLSGNECGWGADTFEGSLDAALRLLAALLPDHDWGRAPGGQMWVQRPPAAPVWSGDGYPPARGLLLAILRAYAGERVTETPDR